MYTIKKKEGGFLMRDLKTYLSVAPVLSTLWFGSLAVKVSSTEKRERDCLGNVVGLETSFGTGI
jgi:hypothetical protein